MVKARWYTSKSDSYNSSPVPSRKPYFEVWILNKIFYEIYEIALHDVLDRKLVISAVRFFLKL
jgi:hypothetical protein